MMKIEPERVLDVGVGFGRWGVMLREFCELWFDRVARESWKLEIEGIEAFEPNHYDHHRHFYDRIHLGDAAVVLPSLEGSWDLVIFGDVLEHFEKSEGHSLIRESLERSHYVLVNVPLGDGWPQDEAYGNPFEEHKAAWHLEDFDPETICQKQEFLDFQSRPFASIVLSVGDPKNLRAGLFGNPEQGPLRSLHPTPVERDPDPLLRSTRERFAALEAIRQSRSWRIANRLRKSRLWRWANHFRSASGSRIELTVETPGIRLEGIDLDGNPLLWDFLAGVSAWQRVPDVHAAFGEALSTQEAGASLAWYTYGGHARVRFHRDGGGGALRLRCGRREVSLDLSEYDQDVIFDFDLMATLPVRNGKTRQSLQDAESVQVSATHDADELSGDAWSDPGPVMAICVPEWTGVRNSTEILIPQTLSLGADYSERDLEKLHRLIERYECESLVISGGAIAHLQYAEALHERLPQLRIKLLWHGSFLQVRETYAWRSLRMVIELTRRGIIGSVGFVKEGMAETARAIGLNAYFVPNFVPLVPIRASEPDPDGPHLGLWLSNEGWRKVPYAMAAAARLIDGAILHTNGQRERLDEFSDLLGGKVTTSPESMLTSDALVEAMKSMHLNLYVTLSECCPMLPLESLSVGTPCLLGPTSHLFRDDRYLFDRLVVPFPDSEASIAAKIRVALEERDEIVAAYRDWAPGYQERALDYLDAFLKG